MRGPSKAIAVVMAAVVATALAIIVWLATGRDADVRRPNASGNADRPIALFTSLPIYWGEAHDLGAMIGGKAAPHWARQAIERERQLRPLDTLDADALDGARDLLLVQPRPLSPDENVALDEWVAGGGRALLFADPALTEDSAYAIGDPRRHQDVVLLSPILGRWGLALEFDDDQPLGERAVRLGDGATIPVNLPGRFAVRTAGRGDAACTVAAEALVADCRVGAGRILAIADAALFERGAVGATPQRRAALKALLERAFAR